MVAFWEHLSYFSHVTIGYIGGTTRHPTERLIPGMLMYRYKWTDQGLRGIHWRRSFERFNGQNTRHVCAEGCINGSRADNLLNRCGMRIQTCAVLRRRDMSRASQV